MGRLEGIHYVNPTVETLAKYGLTWDAASRITEMNLNGEPARYDYDATSQLTSATYEKLPSEAYDYDANGNRKNFETGKNNQLTSDGEFRYTYDDEGNRLTKVPLKTGEKTSYDWDHRNRLVGVTIGTGKKRRRVNYRYDYLNRLTHRNDEIFVHDGWQIVCSLKNGKIEHRYLWGAAQDELLMCDDQWMLRDHLNTVRDVVNAKGKIVSHLEYNAFGELLNTTGDKPLFRYTGKLFDDATGLQWNINRWYDAKAGRWISEDPIGFEGNDFNFVRYTKNNQLSFIDPYGFKRDYPDNCYKCNMKCGPEVGTAILKTIMAIHEKAKSIDNTKWNDLKWAHDRGFPPNWDITGLTVLDRSGTLTKTVCDTCITVFGYKQDLWEVNYLLYGYIGARVGYTRAEVNGWIQIYKFMKIFMEANECRPKWQMTNTLERWTSYGYNFKRNWPNFLLKENIMSWISENHRFDECGLDNRKPEITETLSFHFDSPNM